MTDINFSALDRPTPTGQRVVRLRQTWDEFVEAVRLATGGQHA
jgi:hypothetical protein